jgi:hypothetical protein
MTAPLDQFAALSAMPVPARDIVTMDFMELRFSDDEMDAALDDNVTDPDLRRVRMVMRG